MAPMHKAVLAIIAMALRCGSGGNEHDPLHHVVVVSRRIEDELGGLRGPLAIGGARHDGIIAGLGGPESVAPGAKREAAEVLAELRGIPRAPAVRRHVDV